MDIEGTLILTKLNLWIRPDKKKPEPGPKENKKESPSMAQWNKN